MDNDFAIWTADKDKLLWANKEGITLTEVMKPVGKKIRRMK